VFTKNLTNTPASKTVAVAERAKQNTTGNSNLTSSAGTHINKVETVINQTASAQNNITTLRPSNKSAATTKAAINFQSKTAPGKKAVNAGETFATLNTGGKNKTSVKGSVKTTITAADTNENDIKNEAVQEEAPENNISIAPKAQEQSVITLNNIAADNKQDDNHIKKNVDTAAQKSIEIKQAEKTIAAVQKKKVKSQTWGLGIFVAAGANLTNQSDELTKSLAQDYNGGTSGQPNTGNSIENTNSTFVFNSGKNFSAGVQVYKKLGSSLKISTGLEYNFSTLSAVTGNRVDSAGVSFVVYRNGSGSSFTNHYHYITIPFLLSVRAFSIGNKEVLINGGGSVSKLVSSNTIGFNNTRNRFVTGVDELNKTVFSLSASAAINIAGNNKAAFYIGPAFTYTVTPLASAGLHSGRHAGFIGVRLQKNLWK
jgi:hypothetical protein